MDPDPDLGSRVRRLKREGGFATAQFMVVAAMSMAFMALLLHLIALQYARGVLRSALDEGVRIGAPAAAQESDCVAAIDRVLADLMGGPLGQDVTFQCLFVNQRVVASAEGAFSGWFPGVPDVTFQVEVAGVKESDA
ncbi:MAG TPA: hypothetical protein VJQ57_00920 [Acidimicrobiia bacterium]|nr:hypothetical protein [Acidimicrobiia bacterium]